MDVDIEKKYGERISSIFDGKEYTQKETEDILINGITLPQIEIIRNIMNGIKFKEFQELIWESKENKMTSKKDLNNSAIDLNNKIVELIQYYKCKGFSFYDDIKKTSLARTIVEDLLSSYDKTRYCLVNARNRVNEMPNILTVKLNLDEYEDLEIQVGNYIMNMFCYQKVSEKELWKYNIEKDAVGSILKEFFNCKDKGKFLNHLKIYIEDMKKLRFA